MCVHSLKNTFVAIKSTLKVGHCFFMSQHNVSQQMQRTLRLVTVETQATLKSPWLS